MENHGRNGGRWAAQISRRLLPRAVAVRDNERRDDGFTLSELLVAVFIMAIIGTIAVATYTALNKNTTHGVTRTQAHQTQLDADELLQRDVNEGVTLHVATATELKVDVVRNGACWGQGYTIADGTLKLSTTYYEAKDCAGASVTKSKTLVENLTSGAGFGYYAKQSGVAIPAGALTDLTDIGEVAWNLAVQPAGFDTPIGFNSRGRWSGFADAPGSGKAVQQATAPILAVTTGAAEGKSAPVLTWSDTNPAGYVASWVLLRSANPEGDSGTDPARSTWQQVGPTFPAGITTFTDASLPAGYTGQYVVRPTLSDGTTGPTSNQVVTGMRPSAPTGLTVTGRAQSISMTWTKAVGETGADVYRDGKLIANLGDVTTFTDGPGQYGWVANPNDPGNLGYGHSHWYQVVAQNRWESLLTTGTQNVRTPLGDPITKVYPRGGTRLAGAPVGGFTAPAAPTLTVTPTPSWGWVLTPSLGPWTGSGPSSTATQTRDIAWVFVVNASTGATPSGSWAGMQTVYLPTTSHTYTQTEAQGASSWRWFRAVTTNSVGSSPWSAPAGALQRPSKPTSCTAVKTGITTKQLTVAITPAPATIANSGYDVAGGVGAVTGSPLGLGVQAGTTRVVDRLADGTVHTFTTRAQNASLANGGFSDPTSCSGSTDTLTASVPTWTATTRSVTASFVAGLGTSQSLTLTGSVMGGTAAGTSGSWDLLADGTAYALTATNSDGDNTVTSSTTATTPLLRTPTCSVSGGGTAPSGSITVSASGSNGTPQVAALGSGWYGSPHSWGIGTAGTYTGTASATDGYNRSGSVNCGSVTVSPGTLGNPGPGYDSSDVCNSWMGSGWSLLDAAWVDGGNAGGGYSISTPVPTNQTQIGASLYGTYISGGSGTNNLKCTFYRQHYVKDSLGLVQPLSSASWWDSALWSQAGGAT